MYSESMNWAFSQGFPQGKTGAKMVLIALASRKKPKTGFCFSRLETLADDCAMSKQSVTNHISYLEELGLIDVERSGKSSIRYILNEDVSLCATDVSIEKPVTTSQNLPPSQVFFNQKPGSDEQRLIQTQRNKMLFAIEQEAKRSRTTVLPDLNMSSSVVRLACGVMRSPKMAG